jgi:hypothetical protein
MRHPVLGWTIDQLLVHLNTAVHYTAVAGVAGTGKTMLTLKASRRVAAQSICDSVADARQSRASNGESSHVEAVDVDLLRRRAAMLRRDCWTHASAISDFWIGQSLVYGRLHLQGEPWTRLRDVWHALRPSVVPPKLLVFLDTPGEWLATKCNTDREALPDETQITQINRLQADLRREIRQSPPCPVLHLDARDHQRALAEMTAAVQAMQPQ